MHIFGESVLPEQRSFSMRDTKPFLKYTTMWAGQIGIASQSNHWTGMLEGLFGENG
jgi:hypothetical protein